MKWTAEERERALLCLMRGEGRVQTGGSRCHQTYFYEKGQWLMESFDEGYVEVTSSSLTNVEALFNEKPHLFLHLLASPLWREVGECVAADANDYSKNNSNNERALTLLTSLTRYSNGEDASIWRAVLQWPNQPIDAQTKTLMKRKVVGHTMYHVVLKALSPCQSTGAFGIWWMNQVDDIIGRTHFSLLQRAAFLEMAGRYDEAIEMCRLELESIPDTDALSHQVVQSRLSALHDLKTAQS